MANATTYKSVLVETLAVNKLAGIVLHDEIEHLATLYKR